MKVKPPGRKLPILKFRTFYTIGLGVLIGLLSSCATSRCPICNLDNNHVYNIELKKEAAEKYEQKDKISTYFTPVPLKGAGKKYELHVVDCEGKDAFLLDDGEEKAAFFKDNIMVVDTADILRITQNSDADVYPQVLTIDRLKTTIKEEADLEFCGRVRNSFKIELRGMLGSRLDYSDYVAVPGAVPVSKKLFGFGEEGTKLVFGPEISFLAPVYTVNNKHRFHLGLMTGFWPVDGGNFIPISLHPRFTFNDVASPLSGLCNTIYLFGDIGTAFDLSGNGEKFYSSVSGLNSTFYDAGIGVDLWKTKGMDLSFDLGFRQTTLALTRGNAEQTLLDCLDENNIEYSDYSRRQAYQLFVRFGLTF